MHHHHDHSPVPTAVPQGEPERRRAQRSLTVALVLVSLYMGAEVVGGWLANSLALLADAGHMLSDAASLGLALFAIRMAQRPTSPRRTYGLHRTEILAALINGATLVAVAGFILVEAWDRIRQPLAVDGPLLTLVATGGLVVNAVALWVLHGGRDGSLNVRGAWLHVLSDTLGSLQAIVAGLLIWWRGWVWVDPALSVVIALLVVWSAWALLRDSVHVLMEATPSHIDVLEVERALSGVEGIQDVHDLHVWTITSGFESLSAHARVEGRDRDAILGEARALMRDRFGIVHSTIQLEGPGACEGAGCA